MNNQNHKKLFSSADAILIAVIAAACLLFFAWRHFTQPDAMRIIIEKDGKTVYTASLSASAAPQTFFVDGTNVEVYVHANGAVVISSDCPDQTCVHTGELHHAGDTAVCLPNRVVVRLEGENAPAVDGITG